jgi:hypothetical protein
MMEGDDYVHHLEKKVARLDQMVTIGHLLNSTLDLSELLELIIKTAAKLVDAQTASIMLLDERTGELFFAAATGESQEKLRKIKVPLEGSIAGSIYATGQPTSVDDVGTHAPLYRRRPEHQLPHAILFRGAEAGAQPAHRGVRSPQQYSTASPFDQEDVQVLFTMASNARRRHRKRPLVARLQDAKPPPLGTGTAQVQFYQHCFSRTPHPVDDRARVRQHLAGAGFRRDEHDHRHGAQGGQQIAGGD